MPKTVTVETADGPVDVVTLLFGVKRTIVLICALVAVYDRHRENVVTDLRLRLLRRWILFPTVALLIALLTRQDRHN